MSMTVSVAIETSSHAQLFMSNNLKIKLITVNIKHEFDYRHKLM